jgi:hypothetical protein
MDRVPPPSTERKIPRESVQRQIGCGGGSFGRDGGHGVTLVGSVSEVVAKREVDADAYRSNWTSVETSAMNVVVPGNPDPLCRRV